MLLRFTVLLATYNGAPYLNQQLDSILNQSAERIDIIVSDDGSSDQTLSLLRAWQERWSKGGFTILAGPRQGFAANFRFLLVQPIERTDFVAFADQDDIWLHSKLEAAALKLASYDAGRPALYGSRTELVEADGRAMGFSPYFGRPPAFRNAIVQSVAGGNTMVMNHAGFATVAESARRTGFVSHDWWAYIVISGAGGVVVYDPQPHIKYRQHHTNLVGHNQGLRARVRRIKGLLSGRFSDWSDQNLTGLAACTDMLTPESHRVIAAFVAARSDRFWARSVALLGSGIYRQTKLGQVGLYVATLLRRL